MPDIFVSNPKKNTTTNPQTQQTMVNNVINQTTKKLSDPIVKFNNSVHLFASFCKNPGDIIFQNQEPDEEVLLFVRKDFVTNIPWIIIGALLILVPLFLQPVFANINFQNFFVPLRYLLFFLLFYYLIVGTYIFVNFITWYFNLSLVTNVRVMDIDFSNLVYKSVSATKINLIQDVSYSQVGVVRTIFDYGDVLIQTAGTVDNFIFEAVPNPEEVVHIVEDLIGKERNV